MSKIFANFNLNQSLHNFQVNVTELLQLNNPDQWNGITILQREEKIREAALILAGQCIGILLMQLSKSKEAREKAIELMEVEPELEIMTRSSSTLKRTERNIQENGLNQNYLLSIQLIKLEKRSKMGKSP